MGRSAPTDSRSRSARRAPPSRPRRARRGTSTPCTAPTMSARPTGVVLVARRAVLRDADGAHRGRVDDALHAGARRAASRTCARPVDVRAVDRAQVGRPEPVVGRDVVDVPHARHGGAHGGGVEQVALRDLHVAALERPAIAARAARGRARDAPSREQLADEIRADEPGAARDERVHGARPVTGSSAARAHRAPARERAASAARPSRERARGARPRGARERGRTAARRATRRRPSAVTSRDQLARECRVGGVRRRRARPATASPAPAPARGWPPIPCRPRPPPCAPQAVFASGVAATSRDGDEQRAVHAADGQRAIAARGARGDGVDAAVGLDHALGHHQSPARERRDRDRRRRPAETTRVAEAGDEARPARASRRARRPTRGHARGAPRPKAAKRQRGSGASSSCAGERARLELNRGEDQESSARGGVRAGARRLLRLLALEPGRQLLPAAVSLPVNWTLAMSAYGSVNGPPPSASKICDERLAHRAVAVEDVADDLGAVVSDDRHVAAVVERELDDLGEREVRADLGTHPSSVTPASRRQSGSVYRRPVSVATTVSPNPAKRAERVVDGGRLVAAVDHAVAALRVAALAAVVLPVGRLHQLAGTSRA